MAEWLEAGELAVWIVNPRQRTVTVHENGQSPRTLEESDTLDGGALLPGLVIAVRELFA